MAMENIIYIAVAILMPIIPAYILYKTLPARTTVKGPFKGLNIQLGGAFGGYFLLVLVIFGFFATQQKPPPPKVPYEVWRVKGRVGLNQAAHAALLERDLELSIRPSSLKEILPNGTFWFDMLVTLKDTDGQETREFPALLISHPLFQTATIDLNEKEYPFGPDIKKEYDKKSKEIIIKQPIVLEKK